MNLAANACHAMEQGGGRLSLHLEPVVLGLDDLDDRTVPPGSYLRLVVADTGSGMDTATLARIFDPYFTTRPIGQGTGLGLPLVLGILRNCGGELRVSSEPGRGTVFRLYFPVVEMTAPESSTPTLANAPMEHGSEHILLVDDEKSVADVTASMLTRLGYRVTVRTSSHDGLEAFRSLAAHIDLVLADLNMPQMTGLQLCRELRIIRPGVRVIVCTGFSEQFDAAKARTIGIQGFLNKPVVMAELARMVRTVLDG
jgi:CheY-like chemotaxis protein